MKHYLRHILIWLLLFNGIITYASHVLGGEISYKHIRSNQYKVTLKIYRDCNSCKINGYGGGSSLENCSEIDYLYVRGTDGTATNETKFPLTREKVEDVTPICRSGISACKINNTSSFGIELHWFTAIIDLDNPKIRDLCKYYLYISVAERNSDITTGQAGQNFCIDAYINACANADNNSPDFTTYPTFIINSNTSQHPGFFSTDTDGDSLVYELTSALAGIDKEANYNSSFNYSNPLTVYCPENPCTPDKEKEIGFYFNKSNGSAVFIPTNSGERAVIAVKVTEYRKLKGAWELIGYIKRDHQVYIKTSDGNNSPKFINKDYFELCEGEPLEIKIETKDNPTGTSLPDTNFFSINSTISGASFIRYAQSTAPFNNAVLKWTPSKGASAHGLYKFSVSARDNFCVLNSVSTQVIEIKVKPKEELILKYNDLGCGNFEIKASQINSSSRLVLKLFTSDRTREFFRTTELRDTISFLPAGKYILEGTLLATNGCETRVVDTIYNLSPKSGAYIFGETKLCREIKYNFHIEDLVYPLAKFEWLFRSEKIGSGVSIDNAFTEDGLLQAILTYKKGKWFCSDSLRKQIEVISNPNIIAPDEIRACHNTGNFDLDQVAILPVTGKWNSSSSLFNDHFINTNSHYNYNDDTVEVIYEVRNEQNCIASKQINFIIEAIPQFEISSISICEVNSPLRFEHLIQKPYRIKDYSYTWGFEFNSENIKEENGYKVFYPKDLGDGSHKYFGEVSGKNGCKNYDTASIDITPTVTIKVKNEINICQGSGAIDINQVSGITPDNGNWSFPDFFLIKDRKYAMTDTCGQFEATYVYDNYGCYDTRKVMINIACKPEIKISGLKNTICDSELPVALNASPTGGAWEGDYITNNFFSPPSVSQIKQHTVSYVINQGQCNFRETVTVSVIPSPVINFAPDKLNFCQPELITVSGNVLNADRIIFTYFDETINKNGDLANSEIFKSRFDKTILSQSLLATATNKEGCSAARVFFIKVFDSPQIAVFNDTFICEGSDFKLIPIIKYNGNESLDHSWLENTTEIVRSKDLYTNKLSVGHHYLNFKTGNEFCKDSKYLNLEVKPMPMVDFIIMPSTSTTIMQPGFSFLNQSALNLSWLWDFGSNRSDKFSIEQNPGYTYSDTGNYVVSLTGMDIFGCSNTIYKTVVVRPDLLIFIPNVFSPNNKDEEKNNVYSISLENYNNFSIEIFDRWGHRLFYSEDPKETWDGKVGNVSCTPDVYFYSIKINSITNHLYHYKGTITLIK